MDVLHDGELVEIRDARAVARRREARGRRARHGGGDRTAHGGSAPADRHRAARRSPRNTLEFIDKEAEQTLRAAAAPAAQDEDPRPPGARRRARARLRARSPGAARVHPRVPARADRGRRRRRRAARLRPHPRHHHRRLRLALARSRCTAAPSSCTTCIPTGARRASSASRRPACRYDEFVAEGTSEDAALLLAYEAGAELIVAVGTHATMVEFLDKGRRGMASTFLTRLRLGPVLVDAKGVSRLYQGRVRRRDMVLLVVAGGRGDGRDGLRVALAARVPRRLPADVRRHVVARARLVLTMINFRFHLVSLIAVFLALGLGILVGSTVVDQVIVDRLDREISSVSHESNQLKSDNSKLNDSRSRSSTTSCEGVGVCGRAALDGRAGRDRRGEGRRRRRGECCPGGGARRRRGRAGVLWLDDEWQLDTPKDLVALQTAAAGQRERCRFSRRGIPRRSRRAWRLPAGEGPAHARRDRTAAVGGLPRLQRRQASDLAAFPAHAARAFSCSPGPTATCPPPTPWSTSCRRSHGEGADGARRGVRRARRRGRRRPSGRRARTRSRRPRARKLVDHLRRRRAARRARSTAVIALRQIADGPVGHYGYGEGATESLPSLPASSRERACSASSSACWPCGCWSARATTCSGHRCSSGRTARPGVADGDRCARRGRGRARRGRPVVVRRVRRRERAAAMRCACSCCSRASGSGSSACSTTWPARKPTTVSAAISARSRTGA